MTSQKISKRIQSKNYRVDYVIDVKLIVIHYTGAGWGTVKKLFEKPEGLSAHFVIDINGSIDEVIDALNPSPKRARHAGEGTYVLKEEIFNDINSISIGIELVNYNGNIYNYADAQYNALIWLVKELIKLYPVLNSPERIIGHEDFASYRGKCDPGIKFDWNRFYSNLFSEYSIKNRIQAYDGLVKDYFEKNIIPFIESKESHTDDFWYNINNLMESMLKTSHLLQKN